MCDWWRRVPLIDRRFRTKLAIYYVVWPFRRMHTVIYVLLIKIVSDDRIIYTEIIIMFNVRLRKLKQKYIRECASTKLIIFLCLGPFEFGNTKRESFSSWKDQSSSWKNYRLNKSMRNKCTHFRMVWCHVTHCNGWIRDVLLPSFNYKFHQQHYYCTRHFQTFFWDLN